MSYIVSVVNHKGGVGKTTTTVNLGSGLVKFNHLKKVLLVDLDPQSNLTQCFDAFNQDNTSYDLMHGQPTKPIHLKNKGLEIIPSKLDLSSVEIELSGETGREYILKDNLRQFKKKYELILIDCSPSFGLLTLNALTASDYLIIPIQTQYLAIQGLTKLIEIIDKVKVRLNKRLKVLGLLLTQYDQRRVLDKEVAKAITDRFKSKVFKSRIRQNISLAECPSAKQDIFTYNSKSKGAIDYKAFCKEFVNRLG